MTDITTPELVCEACGMPLILPNNCLPVEPLGTGGFGSTFKAIYVPLHNQGMTTYRVIKRLNIKTENEKPRLVEGIKQAFQREAQILNQLGLHPQIPVLYDYFFFKAPAFESQGKSYPQQELQYLAQQYIAGQDLSRELQTQGRFSEEQIKDVLDQILPVLQFIHENNAIHRDIKPSNIIREGEKLFLIDFGAVKQVVEGQTDLQTSLVFGSPAYAPREQIKGKPVDPSSDLYALAASCIQLLTKDSLEYIRNNDDRWNWRTKYPGIVSDHHLADILDRMLEPNPKRRYRSAEAVIKALENEPTPPPPPPKPLILLITVISLIGLAGWGIWRYLQIKQQNVEPGQVKQLISVGDTDLKGSPQLDTIYQDLKNKGIEAFKNEKYDVALNKFAQIRRWAKQEREDSARDPQSLAYKQAIAALQDPSVLIYKNNAEVRRRHKSGEPIYTIAAAVPLTNSNWQQFNIGQQMLFGIAQAQDKAVNDPKQPINLEVVIANDRNYPEGAKVVAKAISQPNGNGRKILAVVGHYLSHSTCEALKSAYNQAELVVISPLSTQAYLRGACGSSFFFRTTASTKVEAKTLVNHLQQLGLGNPGSTVAIFYRPKDPFSLDLFKRFKQTLKAKTILVQEFDLDADDFDAGQALKKVANATALIVIPDGRNKDRKAFDRSLEVIKSNAGKKIVLGSNPLYDQSIISPSGGLPNLNNKLFLAVDWHPQCAAKSFIAETKNYWLGSVNRNAVLSYEATQVLVSVFRRQPTVTTSLEIRGFLEDLDAGNAPVSDVFAKDKTISFQHDGDRKEINERILITVGDNINNPFVVFGDCR
ncbi:bifunctional serine/threonine-protein kinase/ABC transporter substrate-binding protein [Anabaenopsis tanganyikae CS-531]|uniref:non-specific serine/threonine protein kinase n=2 Tax=Anabaenopsis TaxID=110103 RepID=A0ABT6KA68_9CYAN|nr:MULTISPECIES: bifunctional serine/threonine-protein kinase/ABC transporter substrate-binding protein [Anabaenopsis]MDB9540104.1 bifunctional serine/threonine-protein kinase/ABC transporter substrate-binding protein [Anabaenopsis arnoldii]MDH6092464.1 bifunctional serine/threonine-protein kinase/ABC transporter substrate-binding protein [Anabaenopsis arnoldii]MDH6104334.1 bifunctional serine/threonine-protein kinase/ABC transporter substrate-binding protein [Anabaenopsis tanganyikae CS-531]